MTGIKKKLGQWAYEYDKRLLDESLYQDETLYTQKQFEAILTDGNNAPLNRNDLKDVKPLSKESPKTEDKVEKVDGVLVDDEDDLNIDFEVTKQTKPNIEFGYVEIKAKLERALVKYEKLEVTEENLSEMKTKKTELSHLRTKINDFKINMKKLLKAPIDVAENNLKELIGMIEKVEAPIKAGLEVFVVKEREAKKVKVLGYIDEAYFEYELEPKYRTIEVTDRHLLKSTTIKAIKEDIDTKAKALKLAQDEVARITQEATAQKETDIAFIKLQVKQAEDLFKIKLNEQKYLNKYEGGVETRQIGIDISSDSQDILKNNEIAANKAIKDAQTEANKNYQKAKVNYEKGIAGEPHVDIPEIINNPQPHDPVTGELIEDEVQVDPIEQKFLFTFTVTGNYEQLEALNEYFDEKKLDFENLGFVEVKE